MNYRPNFHLAPPQGRLNDPNGVFRDGDILHVYYQHDPRFPRKPKRTGWGHASTRISVPQRWRHYPDALYPDMEYDRDGCYSGGAVCDDAGGVWLFYTGNLKEGGRRIPSQNRVRAIDPSGPEGGYYRRDSANPLIPDAPAGYTGHVRDPHISRDDEAGWRMILGAQTADEHGTVILYRSTDLAEWEFAGEIDFSDSEKLPGGYMWECPNLIHLAGKDVLIFCPQGETDRCGYIVGELDGTDFRIDRGFTLLDYGTHFYAPQATADGLLLGWMGMPARDESPAEGWVHTLTLPRRLWLDGDVLCQEPIWDELPAVTQPAIEGYGATIDTRGHGAFDLVTAAGDHVFRVRQGDGVILLNEGEPVPCPDGELRLIADGCAVEVFAGGGQFAASFTIFSESPWAGWVPVRDHSKATKQ